MESICTDFEHGLMNACMIVFKNIRIIVCLFHYIKNIRLKALKSGLFSNDVNENTENLIKELGSIPF